EILRDAHDLAGVVDIVGIADHISAEDSNTPHPAADGDERTYVTVGVGSVVGITGNIAEIVDGRGRTAHGFFEQAEDGPLRVQKQGGTKAIETMVRRSDGDLARDYSPFVDVAGNG